MPSRKKDFDFGERAKPATDKAIPAVYLFQPAYYVVLENDELDEWQEQLRKKVGLKPDAVKAMRPPIGTYSLCDSTYFSEACDCDEM